MKDNILKIETVDQYNSRMGIETLHPLVSVIDMSKAKPVRHARMSFGFYTIFLKEVKCGDLIYGRQYMIIKRGLLFSLLRVR